MRNSKLIRRCLAVLLCVLVMASFIPNTVAFAADAGSCTLRIEYLDDDRPLVGVSFRVYRAADLLPHGEYGLTGSFAGCPVELKNQMTNAEWVDAAKVLFNHVTANGILPDYSGKTDSRGILEFSGIKEGLYLIEGDVLNDGTTIYTPQVFCVVVPDRDDNGNPVYFVTVTPKYESTPTPRYGNLIVTKTVLGSAGDTNREWHFTVIITPRLNGWYGDMFFVDGVASFTLKSGQSVMASGLPAWTTYSVAEAEANQDGYVSTWSGGNGVIIADQTVTADFYNRKDLQPQFGNLVVRKTVTGSGDVTREWYFRVTLNSPLNGWFGNMFFIDGVAEFVLKHGESFAALDLPAGLTYTVEELDANYDGYVTTSTGEVGQIPANGTAEAEFFNDLTPPPGDTPPPPPSEYVPPTGDNSHLDLWLILMVVSAVGLVFTILSMRPKRKNASDSSSGSKQ